MVNRTSCAMIGFLALACIDSASATTITVTAPPCVPPVKVIAVPGSGSVNPVSFDCPDGISYAGGGGATVAGGATHTHSLLVVSPKAGGDQGPFTITSGPYTATNGFSIFTLLKGFASYQGNPGGVFTWTATLTATYLGGMSSVTHSGSITGSPQKRFNVFDRQNYPRRKGTGDFVSTLTVSTAGPGELHLERTGIASVAVPEPATWSLLIAGFGLVGGAIRRRRFTTSGIAR